MVLYWFHLSLTGNFVRWKIDNNKLIGTKKHACVTGMFRGLPVSMAKRINFKHFLLYTRLCLSRKHL